MYLIQKIISKCENSSRDWKPGITGKRTLKITQDDYLQCGKKELVEEAKNLEGEGLITIKRWVVLGDDIESISFQVENLSKFYILLEEETGNKIFTKQDRVEFLLEFLEKEISRGFRMEWIGAYLAGVKERVEKGEFPKGTESIHEEVKCLRALDTLEEPMLKRVFSKKYFHDSKTFEKIYEKRVISLAREYWDVVTDEMDNKTVLEQLMIEEYAQELALKGPIRLKIWKGSEGKRVDLSLFPYGAILNTQSLKHSVVEMVQGGTLKKIITIENKANYTAAEYDPEILYVYSHGYFSPLEKDFLIKLMRVFGESVAYYHSGDLDYGGVKIYEYIKKNIFPELNPYQMDVETYNRYETYSQEISEECLEKLKHTQIEDLKDLIDKMIETKRGIEQESFLIEE